MLFADHFAEQPAQQADGGTVFTDIWLRQGHARP